MQTTNNTLEHEHLSHTYPVASECDYSLGYSRSRWPQGTVLRLYPAWLYAGNDDDDDGGEQPPCHACTTENACTVRVQKPAEDDDSDRDDDLGAACLGDRRDQAAAERLKCRRQKRRIEDEKNRLEERRPALDCLKDLRFEMETQAMELRFCLCQPEGESCVREDRLVAEGRQQERRLRELRRYEKQLERWEHEYENAWPKDEKCPEMREAFAYTLELLHRMRCEVYACERLDDEIKELMDRWRDELKWGKGSMAFVSQYFRAREQRHRFAEQQERERILQQKQNLRSMYGGGAKAPRSQGRPKTAASADSDAGETPVSSWEGRPVFDRRTPAVPTTVDLCVSEQPPGPNVSSDYRIPGEQHLERLPVCCRPVLVSRGMNTDEPECSGRSMDIGNVAKTTGIDRHETSRTLRPPKTTGTLRQVPSGTIRQLPAEYLRQKPPGIFRPGPPGTNTPGPSGINRQRTPRASQHRRKISFMC